jgi:hypothetical protein
VNEEEQRADHSCDEQYSDWYSDEREAQVRHRVGPPYYNLILVARAHLKKLARRTRRVQGNAATSIPQPPAPGEHSAAGAALI